MSMGLYGCLKDVLRLFQGCFMDLSSIQRYGKASLKSVPRSFKVVSEIFQHYVKSV